MSSIFRHRNIGPSPSGRGIVGRGIFRRRWGPYVPASALMVLLASCGANGRFDPDFRGWMPGSLTTAEAAATAAPRPAPDARGIITFPNYQVAVAREGETVASVATRIGLGADELARHNALQPTAQLQAGAVLALPRRVAGTVAPAAGATSGTGLVTDPFAGQGTTSTPASPAPAPAAANPREHVVVSGETAWSIARKYNISVQDLSSWNGLPSDMSIRVGQRLMIPAAGQTAPANTTTVPGQGSPTPRPPSAAAPLPDERTTPAATPAPAAEAPDMGANRTAASSGGRFQMPVSGSIIRVYEQGRNDGIDISADAGTAVNAAGGGTVAAITRDTAGVPIVVVRHEGDLMTVYTGLDGLNVAKGDQVSAGQSIGTAGSGGFVHFEVRRGFESVNPEGYLN